VDAKDLIDSIRKDLMEKGFSMPMSKGRDTIARLLYGRNYSPVIAASRAGNLADAKINDIGINDIRKRYGDEQVNLALEVARHYLAN
jgi:hypothetical protein